MRTPKNGLIEHGIFIQNISFLLRIDEKLSKSIVKYLSNFFSLEYSNKNIKYSIIVQVVNSVELYEKYSKEFESLDSNDYFLYNNKEKNTNNNIKIHVFNENNEICFCKSLNYILIKENNEITLLVSNKTGDIKSLILRVMREVMLTNADKNCLVHAACCEVLGSGLLVVGNKHAGKSTFLSKLLVSSSDSYFTSNDLVLVDDKLNGITFPYLVRLDQKTISNSYILNTYTKNHKLSVDSDKFMDFEKKVFLTPKEFIQGIKCNFKPFINLKIVFLVEIQFDSDEISFEKMSKVEKEVILQKSIIKLSESKWPNRWLNIKNENHLHYQNSIFSEKISNLLKELPFYKIKYGTNIKNDVLKREVIRIIKGENFVIK